MSKLSPEELSNLTVEQLLDLNSEDIEELVGFRNYPKGAYSGNVTEFSLPNPSENIEFFECKIAVTACTELEDESEREVANEMIAGNITVTQRYYTKGGYGIANMNTDWAEPIIEAGGVLGQFFAKVQAAPLPVNFILDWRASKPAKNATPEERANFEVKYFSEIKNVTSA